MDQVITPKNTKNQILDAYEALLKKQQEKKTEEPKKVQEQQQKIELTQKARSLSDGGIVKGIAELKVSVSSSLDKLGEQFVNEYKKFDELQKAIAIEKQNLEDLYQLSANTDSLAVMLLAQKEQKEKFEQEMAVRKTELDAHIKTETESYETLMADKRAIWKKEQDEQALLTKETTDLQKKTRTREEEEYIYNLKIERKKEENAYADKKQKLETELTEKKIAFEKEFAERKTVIEEAEAELKTLRTENANFPAKLEKAVAEAIKTNTNALMLEHKFETELKAKEVEGQLMLKDQTITTLNTRIKELETTMKELSAKTVTAEASVKDIAIKAIESSSKPYYIEKSKEGNAKD